MVEWSITPVLKTGVRRRTGGSNPSLSANRLHKGCHFSLQKILIVVKSRFYNDFSLYISLLPDGIMIVIFFHVEIVVNNAKVFMFFSIGLMLTLCLPAGIIGMSSDVFRNNDGLYIGSIELSAC